MNVNKKQVISLLAGIGLVCLLVLPACTVQLASAALETPTDPGTTATKVISTQVEKVCDGYTGDCANCDSKDSCHCDDGSVTSGVGTHSGCHGCSRWGKDIPPEQW
jgi:hypothetical protein